jgi:hypothetical protein
MFTIAITLAALQSSNTTECIITVTEGDRHQDAPHRRLPSPSHNRPPPPSAVCDTLTAFKGGVGKGKEKKEWRG